jgi:hypothetical protein
MKTVIIRAAIVLALGAGYEARAATRMRSEGDRMASA